MSSPDDALNFALTKVDEWRAAFSHTVKESEFDYEACARAYFPRDKLAWAVRFLKEGRSCCAVMTKGYLREGGCTCREQGPYEYRPGMAVADVETIARRHGAWLNTHDALATFPNRGDALTIDPANGQEHVLIARGSYGPTGALLSDDSGNPGCRIASRARLLIAPFNTAPYLQDTDDGVSQHVGRQRPIYGRTVASVVFATLHLCK